jgi:hypothetical protein
MDLSPLVLKNECGHDHSLTQLPIDDVLSLEINSQNGMLGVSFISLILLQIIVNVIIYSFFFF